jgi:hypothetical protein
MALSEKAAVTSGFFMPHSESASKMGFMPDALLTFNPECALKIAVAV